MTNSPTAADELRAQLMNAGSSVADAALRLSDTIELIDDVHTQCHALLGALRLMVPANAWSHPALCPSQDASNPNSPEAEARSNLRQALEAAHTLIDNTLRSQLGRLEHEAGPELETLRSQLAGFGEKLSSEA